MSGEDVGTILARLHSMEQLIRSMNSRVESLDRDTNTRFGALNDRLDTAERTLRHVATKQDLRDMYTSINSGHDAKHAGHLLHDHRRFDDPPEIDMTPIRKDEQEMVWLYRIFRWTVVAVASAGITAYIVEYIHNH